MLYTLAIRVKEINKSRLFLFAVLSVRSRSFEELSALRCSVFNFLRWRLSVCPCLLIVLKYLFEFFTFHGERLEVWNLELEGTPEEAVTKFFLQRVEESMNYFASRRRNLSTTSKLDLRASDCTMPQLRGTQNYSTASGRGSRHCFFLPM